MAFFKFPWLAPKTPAEKSGRSSKAARAETVDVMRRRARHRLMGAALLVIIAVVGFPVVFDTQPRPVPVDARIEIPDRENVAPLVVPADTVAATPAESLAKPNTPLAEPTPALANAAVSNASAERPVPVTEQVRAKEVSPGAPAKTARSESPSPAFVESKPEVSPNVQEEMAVASQRAAREHDAERARALLEGRSGKTLANAPPIPVAAAGGERFIVQVGAFSEDSKVREARSKLERGGITTYTQAVQTKEGKRTRVRVGPFQGREAAEKAAAKIKSLGLPAAVLTL